MEVNEHRLPVISSKKRVVSEPLHGTVRPLSVDGSFGLKILLVKEYKAAGKMILEYQERLLAACSTGKRIYLETHLILEEPEISRQFESISHNGDASEAPPPGPGDDIANARSQDLTQRLAELNWKQVQQLAGLRETGTQMRDASNRITEAMTKLCNGLGTINGELQMLKLSDESK